jgi:hypothetical protein
MPFPLHLAERSAAENLKFNIRNQAKVSLNCALSFNKQNSSVGKEMCVPKRLMESVMDMQTLCLRKKILLWDKNGGLKGLMGYV